MLTLFMNAQCFKIQIPDDESLNQLRLKLSAKTLQFLFQMESSFGSLQQHSRWELECFTPWQALTSLDYFDLCKETYFLKKIFQII